MSIFPEGRPPQTQVGSGGVWGVGRSDDLALVRMAMTKVAADLAERATPDAPRTPLLAASSERLGVVFSELATNALRHGRVPITASLGRVSDGWLVAIQDSANTGPQLQEAAAERAGGHGLRLVLALSKAAGWHRIGTGKCVWAQVGDEPPAGLVGRLGAARLRTGISGQ